MRRTTRRGTTTVLALAIPALVLAGCGSAADDAGGSPAATGTTGEVDYSGTLTLWYTYNEGTPGLLAAVGEWQKQFQSEHPDVEFDGQYVDYTQFTQKVIAANVAGKGPDIMFVAGPTIPDLAQAETILDLTSEWEAFSDASQFPTAILEGGNSFDGKQYGVQAFGNIEGMYVNKTLLATLGLEVPTDKAEFEAALDAATKAGSVGFTGAAMGAEAGEFNVAPLAATLGWSYEDPTNAGMQDALVMQEQWVEKGWRQKNDSTGFVSTDNFLTGKYLFAQDGNWQLTNFTDNATFDWEVISVPGVQDRALIGGESFAIGSTTKNKGLAWAFISESLMSKTGGEIAAKAGSIPLRADVAEGDAVTSNPSLATFADIATRSISIPLNANSGKVSTLLGDTYNLVVAGQIKGEEGAKKIFAELPDLLAP